MGAGRLDPAGTDRVWRDPATRWWREFHSVAVDVISKRRGGPSIIGLFMRNFGDKDSGDKDKKAVLPETVPAVAPTSVSNESSLPADLPRQ